MNQMKENHFLTRMENKHFHYDGNGQKDRSNPTSTGDNEIDWNHTIDWALIDIMCTESKLKNRNDECDAQYNHYWYGGDN